jgi:hypothetical protein
MLIRTNRSNVLVKTRTKLPVSTAASTRVMVGIKKFKAVSAEILVEINLCTIRINANRNIIRNGPDSR